MTHHPFMDEEPWLERVRQGDFSALPDPFTYAHTLHFSHLLHGYRVSEAMGWGSLGIWANERLAEAERTDRWHGSALELWLCLFYEHRRYRHMGEGDPQGQDLVLLDQLCAMLRARLQALSDEERAHILRFMALGLEPPNASP